jgi:hypothetical protein
MRGSAQARRTPRHFPRSVTVLFPNAFMLRLVGGGVTKMDLQEMLRLSTERAYRTGWVTFDQLGELGIEELSAEEFEALSKASSDEGIRVTDQVMIISKSCISASGAETFGE